MIVAQKAQGASFGNISLLQIVTSNIRSLRLADELIAKANLVEDTVVHTQNELVGGIPSHIVHVKEVTVVPAAGDYVGGKILHVHEGTEVLAETIVNTADIGIARSVRSRGSKALVALGQQAGESSLILQDVLGQGYVGIDGRYVQVFDTGNGNKQGCKSECYIFFHGCV